METERATVIVTGSSGLIGSAVVRRLADRFRMVGFDRSGPPHPPPTAECVCVDVASGESVRHGLERVRKGYGERIASVIHLAAYYDFSGEPSPLYQEVTVRGTERLLRGLQDFRVDQFVFSSTMLVHAPCRPGQILIGAASRCAPRLRLRPAARRRHRHRSCPRRCWQTPGGR